jgi:triosephosphate isomerase
VRYFLANWKMHTTVDEAVTYMEAAQQALRDRNRRDGAMPLPIMCPPFVSLVPLRDLVDKELARLGAQNCHWETEGPYTGEISAKMLQGVVDYVMVGHSERRAAGETDDQIAKKVRAVVDAGMTPILFVGEEEPEDAATDHVEQQLTRGLSLVDPGKQDVLLVYEPVWAVGADEAADVDHVAREVGRLKRLLRSVGTTQPEVVYGGTVNDENIETFAAVEVLDGVGATRASLDVDRFMDMLDRLAR